MEGLSFYLLYALLVLTHLWYNDLIEKYTTYQMNAFAYRFCCNILDY